MKYIVAVNASPRSGWNTSQLVEAAAKGAKEAGKATVLVQSTGFARDSAKSLTISRSLLLHRLQCSSTHQIRGPCLQQ